MIEPYLDEPSLDDLACQRCGEFPDDALCPDCEVAVPCDYCSGETAFRELKTGALLCQDCTSRTIDEALPHFPCYWVHGVVRAAGFVGAAAVLWVAFRPTFVAGAYHLDGTIDLGGLTLIGAIWSACGVVHHLIDQFWLRRVKGGWQRLAVEEEAS